MVSNATVLDEMLEPLSRCLDAESAHRVIDFRIAQPVQARIDTLAERANEGLLSHEDRGEYEALVNAADFVVAILKIKVRGQFSGAR